MTEPPFEQKLADWLELSGHDPGLTESKRIVIEGMSRIWSDDWQLICEGIAERTGLSLSNVLLYLLHQETRVTRGYIQQMYKAQTSDKAKETADLQRTVMDKTLEVLEHEHPDEPWKE